MSPTAPSTNKVAPGAAEIGLRHVTDELPGISRVAVRNGFRYVDADGKPVDDDATLARIKSLVIPPAWTDVWISPWANGHIQATGRDAKRRKQYRYHPRWRSVRDEAKYERMTGFGKALPRNRRRVDEDLKRPGLPREKIIATIVHLLQATMMRIIRRVRELPGQELFQYVDDDGCQRSVGSADVNDYLRSLTGEDFTAKDFRTWSGTVLAALALQEYEKFDSEVQARKNIVRAIETVSERLGNTPSICRKCYVHPAVIESYLDGTMLDALRQTAREELMQELHALSPEEAAVVALLQQRLQNAAPPAAAKRKRGSRARA